MESAKIDAPDRSSVGACVTALVEAFRSWTIRVATHAAKRDYFRKANWMATHSRMVERARDKIAAKHVIPHMVRCAIAKLLSDGDPED